MNLFDFDEFLIEYSITEKKQDIHFFWDAVKARIKTLVDELIHVSAYTAVLTLVLFIIQKISMLVTKGPGLLFGRNIFDIFKQSFGTFAVVSAIFIIWEDLIILFADEKDHQDIIDSPYLPRHHKIRSIIQRKKLQMKRNKKLKKLEKEIEKEKARYRKLTVKEKKALDESSRGVFERIVGVVKRSSKK